ncbi:MAG: PH domain-containing protein [Anaerovoracaceae bacterium]
MKEKIRMRCHFSSIFESLWQFWAIIAVTLFNQIDTIIELVQDMKSSGIRQALAEGGIWGLAVILAVTAAVLLFQFLRWRKTWVTLDGNLIIIERNTLNRIHNTIAVENLSAVNVERNLFERIVGTARIKMDTNSMTTADKTDVSLVFREDKAIAFRQAVISRMNQVKGAAAEENLAEDIRPDVVPESIAESGNVFSYGAWDMAKHSFYSMSIINLLIVVGGIASSVWYRTSEYYEPGAILEHAGAIIPVLLVFVSAAYGLIKKYIIYYNFRVYRDGDDLHLRYGLLKLKSYTVPIDKISALQIVQPTISRIFGKYQARIVTVGVGDESSELSNLTMAVSKEELLHQLDVLIPEFMGESIMSGVMEEDRRGIAVRTVKSVKWIFMIAAGAVATGLRTDLPTWIIACCAAGLIGFIMLLYGLSHISAGWKKGEQALVFMEGCFKKAWTVCRYDKVQMISLVAHPAARRMGIKRGSVHMLKMAAQMPYMEDEQAEEIAAAVL